MHRSTKFALIIVSTVGGLVIGAASPGSANPEPEDLRAVTKAVSDLDGHVADLGSTADPSTLFGARVGGVEVTVPASASDPISLEAHGTRLQIELSDVAMHADGEIRRNGIAAFRTNESTTTMPIVRSDGSVQIATVITTSSGPTRYEYDLKSSAGVRTELASNGGINLISDDGKWIGAVAPAWATDAVNTPVATHFEVGDHRIIQIVEHRNHGLVYPIVADPWIGIDLISSTRWIDSSQGSTLSVAVTPWMGAVSELIAATAGWDELNTKVRGASSRRGLQLSRSVSMKQQWLCHAAGKSAIGVSGWLGIDGKPTWDLESWRGTVRNPVTTVRTRCNW